MNAVEQVIRRGMEIPWEVTPCGTSVALEENVHVTEDLKQRLLG